MKEVYILSAVRTPIGSFGGSLTSVPATKLGAEAVRSGIEIRPGTRKIQELFMGQVVQANAGQAPARQVAVYGD